MTLSDSYNTLLEVYYRLFYPLAGEHTPPPSYEDWRSEHRILEAHGIGRGTFQQIPQEQEIFLSALATLQDPPIISLQQQRSVIATAQTIAQQPRIAAALGDSFRELQPFWEMKSESVLILGVRFRGVDAQTYQDRHSWEEAVRESGVTKKEYITARQGTLRAIPSLVEGYAHLIEYFSDPLGLGVWRARSMSNKIASIVSQETLFDEQIRKRADALF